MLSEVTVHTVKTIGNIYLEQLIPKRQERSKAVAALPDAPCDSATQEPPGQEERPLCLSTPAFLKTQ